MGKKTIPVPLFLLLLFHQDLDAFIHPLKLKQTLSRLGITISTRMVKYYRDWLMERNYIRVVWDRTGKHVELTLQGMQFVDECMKIMFIDQTIDPLSMKIPKRKKIKGILELDPLSMHSHQS